MTSTVYFNPQPSKFYKVVSVLDGNKALTLTAEQKLVISDFTGSDSQKFHVYLNNGKYAFVTPNNLALFVVNDSAENGAFIKSDPGQHATNFFDITPVSSGPWAGKACNIKTVSGKSLDIFEGKVGNNIAVVQWQTHGGNNQCWVVTPA